MSVDPGTGLTLLGSAIGGAKLIGKVLGPTADYVGNGLRGWTEKRVDNTRRIFHKAAEKLGDKIEQPGSVPPKVLKDVLEEGSYCDDELTAEYFGGVLASARTGISRDNRAASYLKIIAALSSYEIRLHFLTYTTWRHLFAGSGLRPSFGEDLQKMWTFFSAQTLFKSMEFIQNESPSSILIEAALNLSNHNLLEISHWGSAAHVAETNKKRGWREVSEDGFCLGPTQSGINLWLWSIGAGHVTIPNFLDRSIMFPKLPDVPLPTSVITLPTK